MLNIDKRQFRLLRKLLIIKTMDLPVMTVFPDISIDICGIYFDITTPFDEFNRGTTFLGRQINAEC